MGEIWVDVTGEEIYNVIEENGIPIIREKWFNVDGNNTISACLLGTAGIKLGVVARGDEGSLCSELDKHFWIDENGDTKYIGSYIVSKFDETINIDHEAEILTAIDAEISGENFDWDAAFDTHYNELSKKYPENSQSSDSHEDDRYVLTWKESLAMAKEVLSRVWDVSFRLKSFDYSTPEFLEDVRADEYE